METLLPRLPVLETLGLCKCTRITDRTLAAVARAAAGGTLCAFALAHAPLVTDRGFAALGSGPTWTSLQLHSIPQLGAAALAALGPSLAHVRRLQLWSCERVDDEALMRLAPLVPALEALDLRKCDKITTVAPLLARCSALTSLGLSGLHKLTDSAIAAAVRAAPQLRALDVSSSLLYASALTDASLRALGTHCPALESVDLSSCTRLSTVGVASLRRACTRLKHVNVAGCAQLGAIPSVEQPDWR